MNKTIAVIHSTTVTVSSRLREEERFPHIFVYPKRYGIMIQNEEVLVYSIPNLVKGYVDYKLSIKPSMAKELKIAREIVGRQLKLKGRPNIRALRERIQKFESEMKRMDDNILKIEAVLEEAYQCCQKFQHRFDLIDREYCEEKELMMQAYHTQDNIVRILRTQIEPIIRNTDLRDDIRAEFQQIVQWIIKFSSIKLDYEVYIGRFKKSQAAEQFVAILSDATYHSKPMMKVTVQQIIEYLQFLEELATATQDPVITQSAREYRPYLEQCIAEIERNGLHTHSDWEEYSKAHVIKQKIDLNRIRMIREKQKQQRELNRIKGHERRESAKKIRKKILESQHQTLQVLTDDTEAAVETMMDAFLQSSHDRQDILDNMSKKISEIKEGSQKIVIQNPPKSGQGELDEELELRSRVEESKRQLKKLLKKTDELLKFAIKWAEYTQKSPDQRAEKFRDKISEKSTQKLQEILDQYYKEHAVIGDGSTAAIFRVEVQFQLKTTKESHYYKAQNAVVDIELFLEEHRDQLTDQEKIIILVMLKDHQDALERQNGDHQSWHAKRQISVTELEHKILQQTKET